MRVYPLRISLYQPDCSTVAVIRSAFGRQHDTKQNSHERRKVRKENGAGFSRKSFVPALRYRDECVTARRKRALCFMWKASDDPANYGAR
jgi:hypothetical protein